MCAGDRRGSFIELAETSGDVPCKQVCLRLTCKIVSEQWARSLELRQRLWQMSLCIIDFRQVAECFSVSVSMRRARISFVMLEQVQRLGEFVLGAVVIAGVRVQATHVTQCSAVRQLVTCPFGQCRRFSILFEGVGVFTQKEVNVSGL